MVGGIQNSYGATGYTIYCMSLTREVMRLCETFQYTEADAREMTKTQASAVTAMLDETLDTWTIGNLCELLDLPTDSLDNPETEFTPRDIALAAWATWGAGTLQIASSKSSLSESEFIVLHDYWMDLEDLC